MARILVADDDDLLREFLKVRLAVCGHSIIEAEDGLVALSLMAKEKFDLILLDDIMPGLSGWEVSAAAKRLPQFDATIVIMSHFGSSAIIPKSENSAATPRLQKPFCTDELNTLIDLLSNKSAPVDTARTGLRSIMVSAILVAANISTATEAQTIKESAPIASQSDNITNPAVSFDLQGNKSTNELWTVGASHQWSWISNDAQPEWHDTQISAEYSPEKAAIYTLEVSRSARFGKTDHHISLRGDWRIARNASAYAGITASPEGNFREKWGLRAGGGLGLGSGIEILADSRIARYASGTKYSLSPQLGITSADERIAISAGWINLWESGGQHYQGWSARLRITPNERLRLFAGAARYPEVETGVTRRVQSAFGGLSFQLSDNVNASVSYARDEYEVAYTRQALTFGLRWTLGGAP